MSTITHPTRTRPARTAVGAPSTPRLATLLDGVPQLGREHHWEGELTGARGAAESAVLRVSAHIAFHGSLIEGAGRITNADGSIAWGRGEFTLSGGLSGDSIGFDLWLASGDAARVPLSVNGLLSADGREMSGDWSFTCFYPGACDCDGGGGPFRLQRID